MPEPEVLLSYIMKELAFEKDLKGKKILVTAGPTKEKIDPVRFHQQSFYRKDGLCNCKKCNA